MDFLNKWTVMQVVVVNLNNVLNILSGYGWFGMSFLSGDVTAMYTYCQAVQPVLVVLASSIKATLNHKTFGIVFEIGDRNQ